MLTLIGKTGRNINSKALMGPFAANSDGSLNIVTEAWTNIKPCGFPAQVRVEWEELHEIRNSSSFPFLAERYHYELSQEETQALIDALRQAPIFTPPGKIHEEVHIDSAAERRLAELLDEQ